MQQSLDTKGSVPILWAVGLFKKVTHLVNVLILGNKPSVLLTMAPRKRADPAPHSWAPHAITTSHSPLPLYSISHFCAPPILRNTGSFLASLRSNCLAFLAFTSPGLFEALAQTVYVLPSANQYSLTEIINLGLFF